MPDIQLNTNHNQTILFDCSHFENPNQDIFTKGYWQSKDALIGKASGRGTTYFFKHNSKSYVLRRYRRGGLIGKLLSDQYFYTGLKNTRAWLEFSLLQSMHTQNLHCPAPIAARVVKHGLYYCADIILEKIPEAQDLHHILLEHSLPSETWQDIGKTIADFHNNQVYHHDLNIRNIMLDNTRKAWLIDFDKCAIKAGDNWKKANIERLKRSFHKEASLANIHWQPSDWELLLNAYLQHT
ncbi:3-deoxy-D-manno-octulosonic acid kinase [Paraglaciecola sp. 2405UD69-4]|uniref:3-deoxy-D-manno-octulosonic acid kinase n=1 Tax=Paraglaciecola sp. 2405UD69-4 TaxID=3391836 RepID=UPI0039C93DD2